MKNMIFTILFTVTMLFSSVDFTSFSTVYTGGMVKIEFTTGNEIGVIEFTVEKSSDGIDFSEFRTESSQGSNSTYIIFDKDPFRKANKLYYRVKAKNNDGSYQYTSVEDVIIATSGIRASWGSLKAMFR
ncbi:MAG: hypothetical protein JXR48_03375 [Candidatus Delongbacteria bacterium]|nr:hypothetical protein [Candidatus Delongbacteria bacterium]MBN2833988.1 hypothetical protein [Candidatus Delongbacteria bacterium]